MNSIVNSPSFLSYSGETASNAANSSAASTNEVSLSNPVSSKSAGDPKEGAGHSEVSAIRQVIDQWTQQASRPGMAVQIAADEPKNEIWLNLVDQSTGQIVMKFPPEALRLLESHHQARGLATDVHG